MDRGGLELRLMMDGHTSCLLAVDCVDLRGTAYQPDWREAEVMERTAWESLVTGGVILDMVVVVDRGIGMMRWMRLMKLFNEERWNGLKEERDGFKKEEVRLMWLRGAS